ncbi:MAG TPA: cupin domain-containing protein [Pseudonocardiaceae bacterium]|nr:cupin domain-containing protein [Pseudonocardiaceae bacterium]
MDHGSTVTGAEDRLGTRGHSSEATPLPEGGAETPVTPTMQAVGALVRKLRVSANLSLASLAASAELSPGLLSQIERGIGNPSFTTLIKLAHALEVPVGKFFVSEKKAGALVRAGEHPRLLLAEKNLVYELLTPHINGKLAMIRAQVAAGWSNESEPYLHEGEECVMVTQGELRISVAGQMYVLGEGDSLTYDPGMPHWYHNATEHDAVLIGAMTPPSF